MADLEVGNAYINKSALFVRVILELARGQIIYCDYHADSARLISARRQCSRHAFMAWYDRQLSTEEAARFSIAEAVNEAEAKALEIANIVLTTAPEEMLVAELQRRRALKDTEPND